MQIYLDAEFDSISIQGQFHQMIISIGAIMIGDNHHTCKYFYSLVKPYNFKRLSRVVKKLTNLKDEDISSALSFQEVIGTFRKWIQIENDSLENVNIYSFGPDDKRTLLSNAKLVSCDCEDLFCHIIDLQKEISLKVMYEGNLVSNTLSLDDLKNVYDIEGEVNHHALSDAIDLMQIHHASKYGQLNDSKVQMLVERKALKVAQAKEKERVYRLKEMRNRLSSFPPNMGTNQFIATLKEQLNILNKRINEVDILYYRDYILFKKQKYEYQDLSIWCDVCLENELYVHITLKHTFFAWERKVMVSKYTISIIENILNIIMQTNREDN